MQAVQASTLNKIRQSVDVNSRARVICEWNHNRYSAISSVSNGGSPLPIEFDNDSFPIESIVEPERPTRGVVKSFSNQGRTSRKYSDLVNGARYVTSNPDSKYKYWVSVNKSSTTAPFDISGVLPQVVYVSSVNTNKIRLVCETSLVTPDATSVQITTDGTNWTSIHGNLTFDSKGVAEIYRQSNGTWSSTVTRDFPTLIRGVRLSITSLSAGGYRASVIEVSARIESEISDYVISYGSDSVMSDTSFVTPIGKASSGECSVVIDNTNNIFNNSNSSSIYYNIIDKNVSVYVDIGINRGTLSAPDYEWIRQFTGRSTAWNGQTREGTTLALSDDSEYIKTVYPLPNLITDMSAAEIIWRMIDSVGFSRWQYDPVDIDPTMLVQAYWCDGEKTVWECITEIAEVSQIAIYFDQHGVIQIVTRSRAYSLSNAPVWQLNGQTDGANLADIVEIEETQDFEANVVEIEYTPTALSEESPSGIRPMEVIWEPEDTEVLRSSQITASMSSSSTTFSISSSEAGVWPYESVVQIEGEFLRYTAKQYAYYNASSVLTKVFIKSNEEKERIDKVNQFKSYLNHFTGVIQTSIENRGIWSTGAGVHDIYSAYWTNKRYRNGGGPVRSWSGGWIPNANESTIRLKTPTSFISNTWYACTVGSQADTNIPFYYGTRIKFDTSGALHGNAGIVIGCGNNDSGYYVEIQRTNIITPSARTKYNHEIWICYKDVSGNITRINKGTQLNITAGVWYDMDVKITPGTSSRTFNVLINGVSSISATHNATVPIENRGARCGIFVRNSTSCQFEYFYNSRDSTNPSFDQATWWDKIRGGYQSNQSNAEITYDAYSTRRLSSRASVSRPVRSTARFFDEFGPIVHEVRKYDVKFEKSPVVYSQIYLSNDTQIICPEYNSSAFGAQFILANASRQNAVASGEDTITFGVDNPVSQKMIIYGRNFIEEDSRKHTVEDATAIKRRGRVVTQIASKWIQSESAAKELGSWILRHWSGGNDQVQVTVFGNPLIQIADVVSVNYPNQNMTVTTHEYFVVGIGQQYDGGIETTITLRRRKI